MTTTDGALFWAKGAQPPFACTLYLVAKGPSDGPKTLLPEVTCDHRHPDGNSAYRCARALLGGHRVDVVVWVREAPPVRVARNTSGQ